MTFATDVFHPLIVPLTTYTFSTSSASDNPVSATDDERLPPGGFSLRHGFPHWFGRAKRSGLASGPSSRNVSWKSARTETEENIKSSVPPTEVDVSSDAPEATEAEEVVNGTESPRIAQIPSESQYVEVRKVIPVAELLDYIRSTFDDESVLDSLPVEVAGNPGAWHAWKAHRRGADSSRNWKKGSPQARQPGDWHWDGIWARRVHDEIEASHSDPMLFGGATRGSGDEMVSFVHFVLSKRCSSNSDTVFAVGRRYNELSQGENEVGGKRTYKAMIRACLNIPSPSLLFALASFLPDMNIPTASFYELLCLSFLHLLTFIQDDQYLIP